MSSFAIFLRGINVGGISIKMADLKVELEKITVTDVKTLLASGNVVCASELSAKQLKTATEQALRQAFGYDAWVVICSKDEVASIVSTCPYPADDPTTHSYITLASNPDALDQLLSDAQAQATVDSTRLSPHALAWLAPRGGTLESPLSKISTKAKYKATTTTRNIRTMIKCLDALNKINAAD